MKVVIISIAGLFVALGLFSDVPLMAADVNRGNTLFKEKCSVCHNATTTDILIGPGLKGIFKKTKLSNGKPVKDVNVREVIGKGGNVMPPFGGALKPAEIEDLIGYLKTL